MCSIKSFFCCRCASPSFPLEAALLLFGNGGEVLDRGGCVIIGLRFDRDHGGGDLILIMMMMVMMMIMVVMILILIIMGSPLSIVGIS